MVDRKVAQRVDHLADQMDIGSADLMVSQRAVPLVATMAVHWVAQWATRMVIRLVAPSGELLADSMAVH